MIENQPFNFTAAQLAVAGTVISDPQSGGYDACAWLKIIATLTGLTVGTLDVYVQDSPDGKTWYDYAHFAQVAAAAARATFICEPAMPNSITSVGNPTTDPNTPAPALAAGTCRGGHPMGYMRVVCVAGAGTSGGAAQSISIIAR